MLIGCSSDMHFFNVDACVRYVIGIDEAEAFSERLKKELGALEAANVHAILESEPLVEEVSSTAHPLHMHSTPVACNAILTRSLPCRALEKQG